MSLTKFSSFLKRSKVPIDIEDDKQYKRVTIRISHNGVSIRDNEIGKKIGTKKQFLLKAGQFVMSKIDARYGAFGIAPDSVEGAIITGNFWAYDVDKKKVNIEWFNQFTNSPVFYEVCERASSGITHRKYLNESFFLNYEIFLPPIAEQLAQIEKIKDQKIVFGEITTQITHQLSLVSQLRQSFLREAMQGRLVIQNPSDGHAKDLLATLRSKKSKLCIKDKPLKPIKPIGIPFELPKNWLWCSFIEVVDIESKLVSPFDYPNYPHIAPDNIEKNTGRLLHYKTVKEDDVKSANHYFYPGQLIYSKVRPKLNKVVKVNFDGLCSADMYPLRPLIDIDYLHFCMLSAYFLAEVDKFDNRVKMPKINQNQLSQIPVPLPPLSEQHRIVAKLDQLMQTCDALEASIKQSREQNEKLLQQVLREAIYS